MFDSHLEKLNIRPVRKDEYELIFNLCEKRFGSGYLTPELFESWLENPQLFLAAEYEGNFSGIVCYVPQDAHELAEYLQLTEEYIKGVSGGRPVIHCQTAVLVPEYEHRGIMQALVTAANENAQQLGFGAAFAPAWKYNGFVPVRKMMLRLGFKEIAEKENIWYNTDGYICVICGGRCKCSAVIFQKEFQEK